MNIYILTFLRSFFKNLITKKFVFVHVDIESKISGFLKKNDCSDMFGLFAICLFISLL